MKIKGIDDDILRTALAQAKDGRQHILNEMNKVLNAPRQQLSKYAPKIITFAINPDKIREVIGSGGKVINKIIDDTGVKIDISDEGLVSIAGENSEMTTKAKNIIMGIVEEIELGKTYIGTVVKTLPFGAFVDVLHGKEGMIHISKLSDKQVATVEEIVRTGDKVEVDVIKIDEKGRVNLKLNKIILNK